jgi:hypothetical protein
MNNIIMLLLFNEMVELVGPWRVPGYMAQYWLNSVEDRHVLSRFLYFVFNWRSNENPQFVFKRSSVSLPTRSLSDLRVTQSHFSFSAAWNFTFPQLLWYHRPHESHWVPDFNALLQPLHETCTMLSAGSGFSSTPLIINKDSSTTAHRIICPTQAFPPVIPPWPAAVRHETLMAQ